jgi:hypothetical protein
MAPAHHSSRRRCTSSTRTYTSWRQRRVRVRTQRVSIRLSGGAPTIGCHRGWPSDDGLATRTAITQVHKSISSRLSASSDETFPQATLGYPDKLRTRPSSSEADKPSCTPVGHGRNPTAHVFVSESDFGAVVHPPGAALQALDVQEDMLMLIWYNGSAEAQLPFLPGDANGWRAAGREGPSRAREHG